MAAKSGGAAANPELEAALGTLASPLALDIQAAADLGAKAKGVEIATIVTDGLAGLPPSVPVALLRGDSPEVDSVKARLEEFRLFPERKAGTATADTLDSFVDLTNRHKVEDSVIFANPDWRKPSFTAVIDYHQKRAGGEARFGRHRIHYAFPLSDEWKAWIEMDGKAMSQSDFAWFLEDRVAELASPTDAEKALYESQFATTVAVPSQIVELSRGLKVQVEQRVRQAVTLATGEGQIAWEEAHDTGTTKVPGIFMLAIAPFFMGDKTRIPVRLRYRLKDGKLIWSYQIYRPDLAITEHVTAARYHAADATGLPSFDGKPEMAGASPA